MKQIITMVLITCVGLSVSCNGKTALKTDEQKQSYSYGYFIGSDLANKGAPIDPQAIISGIKDGLNEKNQLSEEDMADALRSLDSLMREAYTKKVMEKRAKNLEASDSFLAANKSKDGITETKSGLQYKVITNGKGKSPSSTDTVVVHYKGSLINGTEFDSSYKRNEPAEFKVTQVIKGWTEALQLMKEGSKWELYIPPTLAYGDQGAGGLIGPNEALVFEVELLKIK